MFFGSHKEKTTQKNIIIISKDSNRLSLISDYFTVKGFEVKTYQCTIQEFSHKLDQNTIEAIVIDLGKIENHQKEISLICHIFPIEVVRIVFADNDSIAIKQNFLDKGIGYLHFNTQFQQLHIEIENLKTYSNKPNSIHIGVLGTKGGIGNSFISYHISKIIYQRYMTKTLLIQGAYSSFNIDLLSNREFDEKDFRDNDICLIKEKLGDSLPHKHPLQHSFNFIVYDHSVQCMNKDQIEQILNSSDCIILLISYELSSIRKAKEVLLVNEFLQSVNQGTKKIIIALNELSPHKPLNKAEIEEILNKKIHRVIPFNNHKEELKNIAKNKTKKELEGLVLQTIGSTPKQEKNIREFFKGFL